MTEPRFKPGDIVFRILTISRNDSIADELPQAIPYEIVNVKYDLLNDVAFYEAEKMLGGFTTILLEERELMGRDEAKFCFWRLYKRAMDKMRQYFNEQAKILDIS